MPGKLRKFVLVVQFGVAGNRIAEISVTESSRMMDVAREFQLDCISPSKKLSRQIVPSSQL